MSDKTSSKTHDENNLWETPCDGGLYQCEGY